MPIGQIPWNKGKTGIYSEETIEKLRIAGLNNWQDEDYKDHMSEVHKGKPSGMKGKYHTKEAKEKNRLWHIGRPIWNKGKTGIFSDEALRKMRFIRLGSRHSKETIKKIRLANLGEKSPSWRGGISFEPYAPEFNKQLKELIRQRDDYKCQKCGMPECENIRKLDIHHIDYIKKNCLPNNLIALCVRCNAKVNFNRDYWTEYFKEIISKKNK